MNHRILAIDAYPIVLKGYETLLKDESNLTIVGTTTSAAEATTLVEERDPDLILMDLILNSGSGIELIKRLKAHNPHLKIVIISGFDDIVLAGRALQAGARGYVPKSSRNERIVQAIHSVIEGGIHVSDSLEEMILKKFVGEELEVGTDNLTDRELDVLKAIGKGLSSREIANRLHISIKTVQTHRANIMEKLNVDTKEKLIRHAVIWTLDNPFAA